MAAKAGAGAGQSGCGASVGGYKTVGGQLGAVESGWNRTLKMQASPPPPPLLKRIPGGGGGG